MDTATQIETLGEAISNAVMGPNEARRKVNLPAVAGGETPYLQQQNYSLAALAKRDARDDPFAVKAPPAPSKAPGEEDVTAKMLVLLNKRSPEGLVLQ